MVDILSLDDARTALRLTDNDSTHDDDLLGIYIPATTALVEGITGPIVSRTVTALFDGGSRNLLLPFSVTAVTSITVSGVALAVGQYVVNLPAGTVLGVNGSPFDAGLQNVAVTYTAGIAATQAAVPAAVKLASRIILSHLYQTDQQGFRPAFNGPDTGVMSGGIGYALPNRAADLLAPFAMPPRVA